PLCDGWELVGTTALDDHWDEREVLKLAASVSTCAGSPWGIRLPAAGTQDAIDGTFDGRVASAEVSGERWLLGPDEGTARVPSHPDEQMLVVLRQRDRWPVGALILRPRLSRGVKLLTEACRVRGVRVELATRTATPLVRHLAERAGVPVFASPAHQRVTRLRREGSRV